METATADGEPGSLSPRPTLEARGDNDPDSQPCHPEKRVETTCLHGDGRQRLWRLREVAVAAAGYDERSVACGPVETERLLFFFFPFFDRYFLLTAAPRRGDR
jgi:hypothetical protein